MMTWINQVTDLSIDGEVAIVTIDSPPVNALSAAIRQGLDAAFAQASADPGVAAIVLICAGRTFFAGADIREFGTAMAEPSLLAVQDRIERAGKPVVAAIHGTALGGGLEVALVCDYRIAAPSAQLGLPEVKLGLLPGAGGTQRLPRIVGAEPALKMMLGGEPVSANDALAAGLIDAMASEVDLRGDAIAYARQLIAEHMPQRMVSERTTAGASPELFANARAANARDFEGFEAPNAIVECVEASTRPFADGIATERRLFDLLMAGRQAAAQRYLFFAERQVARIDAVGRDVRPLPLRVIRVIGEDPHGLTSGEPDAPADLLLSIGPVAGCIRDGAILGLTTASTSLAAARDTLLTDVDVIGLRFHGRAGTIRLVEIIHDEATKAETIATAMALAKRLAALIVHSAKGGHSIGDRLVNALRLEVKRLLDEGKSSESIAAALEGFGLHLDLGLAEAPSSDDEGGNLILARCLDALRAEALQLLADGVARSSADIDVLCVGALGWPRFDGGPLFEH